MRLDGSARISRYSSQSSDSGIFSYSSSSLMLETPLRLVDDIQEPSAAHELSNTALRILTKSLKVNTIFIVRIIVALPLRNFPL